MGGFAINAILMIFLHLAPSLGGAGWSIYQNHGIHVDYSHVYHQRHVSHHRSKHHA